MLTWAKDYSVYTCITPNYIQIYQKNKISYAKTDIRYPKNLSSLIKFCIIFQLADVQPNPSSYYAQLALTRMPKLYIQQASKDCLVEGIYNVHKPYTKQKIMFYDRDVDFFPLLRNVHPNIFY
jgi:hypothetical protein